MIESSAIEAWNHNAWFESKLYASTKKHSTISQDIPKIKKVS